MLEMMSVPLLPPPLVKALATLPMMSEMDGRIAPAHMADKVPIVSSNLS